MRKASYDLMNTVYHATVSALLSNDLTEASSYRTRFRLHEDLEIDELRGSIKA